MEGGGGALVGVGAELLVHGHLDIRVLAEWALLVLKLCLHLEEALSAHGLTATASLIVKGERLRGAKRLVRTWRCVGAILLRFVASRKRGTCSHLKADGTLGPAILRLLARRQRPTTYHLPDLLLRPVGRAAGG